MIVNVITLSEKEEQESSRLYGGYWTWGEGMRHQLYDVTTYQIKQYTAIVYCDSNHYHILYNINNTKSVLLEMIKGCIQHQKSSGIFVHRFNDKDYFITLDLKSDSELRVSPEQFIKLFTATEQQDRILIKVDTYDTE